MSETSSSSSESSLSVADSSAEGLLSSVTYSDSSDLTGCIPDAIRILVSVASLTDMAVLPTTSPGVRQLYRTDSVAIISRSKAQMDRLLDKIVADLQVNVMLQGLPNTAFEIVQSRDAVPGSNQDQLFPLR